MTLGALASPADWVLEAGSRLIARVKPASAPAGGPGDSWWLLIPGARNTVVFDGKPVGVTVELIITAGAEIGASIAIEGAGIVDLDVTVFIDIGTPTAPSFAFFGVVAGQTVPSPAKTTATVTTPVTGLASLRRLGFSLDATEVHRVLNFRGGRYDVPVVDRTVRLAFTRAVLDAAVAALGPRGAALTAGIGSLLGASVAGFNPLDLLNPTPTPLPETATARTPARPPDSGALTDPSVPSMFALTAAIPRDDATWNLAQIAVDVGFDTAAPAGAETTTVEYRSPAVIDVVPASILTKTPEARDNITESTAETLAALMGVPTQVRVTTATLPPVGLGATPPDPLTVPPALTYLANGRLATAAASSVSRRTVLDPTKPHPAALLASRAELTDLSRALTLRTSGFDPNRPDDSFLDVEFVTETGAADAPGRLRVASAPTSVAPTLLGGAGQRIHVNGASGLTQVVARRLHHARLEIDHGVQGPHELIRYRASYEGLSVEAADVELISADGQRTHLAVDELPLTLDLDLELPTLPNGFVPSVDWATRAELITSTQIGAMTLTTSAHTPESTDDLRLEVRDGPARLTVDARCVASTITASIDGGTSQVGPVHLETAHKEWKLVNGKRVDESFVDRVVDATSVPSWAEVRAILAVADAPRVHYRSIDPIASVRLIQRSTDLAEPVPGRTGYDHLEVRAESVPPTADTRAVALSTVPIHVDTKFVADKPPMVRLSVPTAEPIGRIDVELSPDSDTLAPGSGTRGRVQLVDRKAATAGNSDPLGSGARRGRRLWVSLPGVRGVDFDMQAVTPDATVSLGALEPLWAGISLEEAVPIDLSYGRDDPDDNSELWVDATVSELKAAVVEARLKDATDGTHAAIETNPASPTLTGVALRHQPLQQWQTELASAEKALFEQLSILRADFRVELPRRLSVMLGGRWLIDPIGDRVGTKVDSVDRQTLPGERDADVIDAWVQIRPGLAGDDAGFAAWTADHASRAAVEILDHMVIENLELQDVPPASPVNFDGDRPSGGGDGREGPKSLFGRPTTAAVASLCLMNVRGLEYTTDLVAAELGQKPTKRLELNLGETDFPVEATHSVEGQVRSRIDARIEPLGSEPLRVAFAGATDEPVIGQLASFLTVNAQTTSVSVSGHWEHGFPNVRPPAPRAHPPVVHDTTPAASARPEGITAIDMVFVQQSELVIRRRRRWSARPELLAPPPDPAVRALAHSDVSELWRYSDLFVLDVPSSSVTGTVVFDRPPEPVLQVLPPPEPHRVVAVQGRPRVVDYGEDEGQLADPFLARAGESVSPYAVSLDIPHIFQVEAETTGLVDQNGRSVPVVISQDTASYQLGDEEARFVLATRPLDEPFVVQVLEFEATGWQDSVATAGVRNVADVTIEKLPPELTVSTRHDVLRSATERPLERSTLVISSAGLNRRDGPALGACTLELASLTTAKNRWVPVVETASVALTDVPGFVQLDGSANLSVALFPPGWDGSPPAPTRLDIAGWDTGAPRALDPFTSSQLSGVVSGPLRGSLTTVGVDARLVSGLVPTPFVAPAGLAFDRRVVAGLDARPTQLPVPTGGPAFSISSVVKGPGDDDEKSGVALMSQCGSFQVSATVDGFKSYGNAYTGLVIPPLTDWRSQIRLTDFSGQLSIYAKELSLSSFSDAMWLVLIALIPSVGLAQFLLKTLLDIETIEGVLADLSPVLVEPTCTGDWYVRAQDLDDMKIFDGLGRDRGPGSFDLNTEGDALVLIVAGLLGLVSL